MSYLTYLFRPEDSTHGLTEAVQARIPRSVRTVKTALWITMAMVMSVGISRLG
ncbi:MAG: hypothetical protein H0S80_08965 [Desulfovibrionaceae bacterium]|nr:hypothetical protein [Desulfovibrionaceae bacterium]